MRRGEGERVRREPEGTVLYRAVQAAWGPFLCSVAAGLDGFSLHAGAWVSARDRERLEKLCRYAGRPAVAESRLVELPDGRIGYALKKRWRDGTTAVVMTKSVLMERLCALVPRPRKHLVTYHGCWRRRLGCGRGWCRGARRRKVRSAAASTALLAELGDQSRRRPLSPRRSRTSPP